MFIQMVSVNADTVTTPVCCTDGGSGYTLYVYAEDSSSRELGVMRVSKRGTTGTNTFTNSNKCAPLVMVSFDEYTLEQHQAGSSSSMHQAGYAVSKSVGGGSSSSNAYGCARVGY